MTEGYDKAAMPREERRIIFDYSQVYKAIHTLCAQKENNWPPPGSIIAIRVKADQVATLKFRNAKNGAETKCDYSFDFLIAALILYCRVCSIPLPKRGRKTVEVAGEEVILRVTIDSVGVATEFGT